MFDQIGNVMLVAMGFAHFVQGVPKIDFHMTLQHHDLKLNILNTLILAKILLTNANCTINQLLIFMANF